MKIYKVTLIKKTVDTSEVFYVEAETIPEAINEGWTKSDQLKLKRSWSFSVVEVGEKR